MYFDRCHLCILFSMSNWQTYFSKEFEKREFEQVNPFIPEVKQEDQPEPHHNVNNYFTMPLETRIHLLHLLCEVRLSSFECRLVFSFAIPYSGN